MLGANAGMPHSDQADYWRRQAEEARRLAAIMSLASDRRIMLTMAENYERLAQAAEDRETSKWDD